MAQARRTKSAHERARSTISERLANWRGILKELGRHLDYDVKNEHGESISAIDGMPLNTVTDIMAQAWLRPAQDHKSPSLCAACNYFGLDVGNRAHVRMLLAILADACFGRDATKGRRKSWDRERYLALAEQLAEVKQDNPNLSDARAASLIKRRFPDSYRAIQADQIRNRLPEARQRHEVEMRLREWVRLKQVKQGDLAVIRGQLIKKLPEVDLWILRINHPEKGWMYLHTGSAEVCHDATD